MELAFRPESNPGSSVTPRSSSPQVDEKTKTGSELPVVPTTAGPSLVPVVVSAPVAAPKLEITEGKAEPTLAQITKYLERRHDEPRDAHIDTQFVLPKILYSESASSAEGSSAERILMVDFKNSEGMEDFIDILYPDEIKPPFVTQETSLAEVITALRVKVGEQDLDQNVKRQLKFLINSLVIMNTICNPSAEFGEITLDTYRKVIDSLGSSTNVAATILLLNQMYQNGEVAVKLEIQNSILTDSFVGNNRLVSLFKMEDVEEPVTFLLKDLGDETLAKMDDSIKAAICTRFAISQITTLHPSFSSSSRSLSVVNAVATTIRAFRDDLQAAKAAIKDEIKLVKSLRAVPNKQLLEDYLFVLVRELPGISLEQSVPQEGESSTTSDDGMNMLPPPPVSIDEIDEMVQQIEATSEEEEAGDELVEASPPAAVGATEKEDDLSETSSISGDTGLSSFQKIKDAQNHLFMLFFQATLAHLTMGPGSLSVSPQFEAYLEAQLKEPDTNGFDLFCSLAGCHATSDGQNLFEDMSQEKIVESFCKYFSEAINDESTGEKVTKLKSLLNLFYLFLIFKPSDEDRINLLQAVEAGLRSKISGDDESAMLGHIINIWMKSGTVKGMQIEKLNEELRALTVVPPSSSASTVVPPSPSEKDAFVDSSIEEGTAKVPISSSESTVVPPSSSDSTEPPAVSSSLAPPSSSASTVVPPSASVEDFVDAGTGERTSKGPISSSGTTKPPAVSSSLAPPSSSESTVVPPSSSDSTEPPAVSSSLAPPSSSEPKVVPPSSSDSTLPPAVSSSSAPVSPSASVTGDSTLPPAGSSVSAPVTGDSIPPAGLSVSASVTGDSIPPAGSSVSAPATGDSIPPAVSSSSAPLSPSASVTGDSIPPAVSSSSAPLSPSASVTGDSLPPAGLSVSAPATGDSIPPAVSSSSAPVSPSVEDFVDVLLQPLVISSSTDSRIAFTPEELSLLLEGSLEKLQYDLLLAISTANEATLGQNINKVLLNNLNNQVRVKPGTTKTGKPTITFTNQGKSRLYFLSKVLLGVEVDEKRPEGLTTEDGLKYSQSIWGDSLTFTGTLQDLQRLVRTRLEAIKARLSGRVAEQRAKQVEADFITVLRDARLSADGSKLMAEGGAEITAPEGIDSTKAQRMIEAKIRELQLVAAAEEQRREAARAEQERRAEEQRLADEAAEQQRLAAARANAVTVNILQDRSITGAMLTEISGDGDLTEATLTALRALLPAGAGTTDEMKNQAIKDARAKLKADVAAEQKRRADAARAEQERRAEEQRLADEAAEQQRLAAARANAVTVNILQDRSITGAMLTEISGDGDLTEATLTALRALLPAGAGTTDEMKNQAIKDARAKLKADVAAEQKRRADAARAAQERRAEEQRRADEAAEQRSKSAPTVRVDLSKIALFAKLTPISEDGQVRGREIELKQLLLPFSVNLPRVLTPKDGKTKVTALNELLEALKKLTTDELTAESITALINQFFEVTQVRSSVRKRIQSIEIPTVGERRVGPPMNILGTPQ